MVGNNRATLTLKAGATIVSKTSIAMAYFTQLNALGMCAEYQCGLSSENITG
jgi:hypothetical protein